MAGYIFSQFTKGSFNTNGNNTLLTVPSGHIYLLKQLSVNVTPSGANEVRKIMVGAVEVCRAESGATARESYNFTSPSNVQARTQEVHGTAFDLVLLAGDTLVLNVPNTQACDVVASGVDYTI